MRDWAKLMSLLLHLSPLTPLILHRPPSLKAPCQEKEKARAKALKNLRESFHFDRNLERERKMYLIERKIERNFFRLKIYLECRIYCLNFDSRIRMFLFERKNSVSKNVTDLRESFQLVDLVQVV